ncbi:MAG: DUF1761 domain-containing protein [Alphaproteobacteria bacterium]|nr:DUF1761 domain-containing protein [Alphaproteobacteria bacterium]
MIDLDIHFGAFLLSGIFAFILGVIWYHPKVMGDRWMEVRGAKKKDVAQSALPFVASLFLWLLAACFYAFLASFLEIDTASGYFALSCLLWVAFAMPPALMGSLYTEYPFEAVAIDTSYQLGGYYVFAGVHIAFLQMGAI